MSKYFTAETVLTDIKDIYFSVNEDAEDIPDEIISFKNEIEDFIYTIQSLFPNDSVKYNYYYQKIFAIADLAFNSKSNHVKTAKNSMGSLKSELSHDATKKIRATILVRYIKRILITSIILYFLSVAMLFFEFGKDLYHQVMLSVGSLFGCWISIAVRTKKINYEEIVLVLNDEGNSLVRIMFMLILSFSIAILMKGGLLVIELGGVSSKQIDSDIYVALSFGFIIGFAELFFTEKIKGVVK
ncbi:hypothetical protein [Aeromonas veronii]|uniref:hypothetical protein n=1 Tax=Aeromonas veronii TaxID=654 RepID=UPI002B4A1F9C|nr:hypothetical protein [Aeromonas veronii]